MWLDRNRFRRSIDTPELWVSGVRCATLIPANARIKE